MAKISITRGDVYADRARAYKVFCNNECIGTIANNESKSFSIPEEECEVFLKLDWYRSNKVTIQPSQSDLFRFTCGTNLKNFSLVFSLFYMLFQPHKYLWLKLLD